MAKLNHSATLSIGGAIASSWSQSVGAIRSGTDSIKKQLGTLKNQQRSVNDELRKAESAASQFGIEGSSAVSKLTTEHKRLKGQQTAVEAELKRAQRAAAKLGKDGSADVDKLLEKSEQLERQEREVAGRLDEAKRAASRFGVEGSRDVARLRGEHEKLDKVLDRQRRKLANAKAWENIGVGGKVKTALVGTAKNVGDVLTTMSRQALYAGTAFVGGAAAGIGWFTKSAIDATAEMERMETALVTLEGSNEKAAESSRWIQKFAATTPFELGEVSEAFNRLRAYGIDPTNGTLRTLGDTGASMGKTVMDGVEALADALTGQNERLKEFGIRASAAGNKITYFYKNAAGEDVKKTVNKNSQEMIRSTLMAIWNEKYAGSMDRQSKTWKGMMSNLSDQWTLFQVRVMRSGVFDALKLKLGGLLDKVAQWAEDGTLERWADEIASAYEWAFDRVEEGFSWVREHWPEIKQGFSEFVTTAKETAKWLAAMAKSLSDAVGGPENLAKGLALLGAAKVLSPLTGLVGVGFQIVGWLSKATGLTGVLQTGLGKVGGALAGAGKVTGGAVATGAGKAAAGAGGLLAGMGATSVGAASGAAIAGTVAAGAAAGAGVGMGVNYLTEKATGRSLSDHIAYWLTSDIDKQRAEMAAGTKARGVGGLEKSAGAATRVEHHDNRKVTVHVEAKSADAKEVAREVVREMNADMRREQLASYAPGG
jgi:hypothetical protein